MFQMFYVPKLFQVQHVTRVAQKHCHCSEGKCEKLKVKKVGEGKYNIAGRNVFVRVCTQRAIVKVMKTLYINNYIYSRCRHHLQETKIYIDRRSKNSA